jgi:hypothetical protein
VTFRTPNGIIEGKLWWVSGLSIFLGKSGLNTENMDGLAAMKWYTCQVRSHLLKPSAH